MATVVLPAVIEEARQRQRRRRNLFIVFLAAFAVAAGATLLTVFRVGLGNGLHVSFRQSETFQATEFLGASPVFSHLGQRTVTPDPGGKLSFYAEELNSDAGRAAVFKDGPLRGRYVTSAEDVGSRRPSYAIVVNGTASNPRQAVAIVNHVATIAQADVQRSEAQTFPPSERIRILGWGPPRASLLHGRSVERPLVLFIVLFIISLAVAKLAMRRVAAVRSQRS